MSQSQETQTPRSRQLSRATWRKRTLKALSEAYPDPTTELDFENVFQLLVAVVLSAQTTDVRVNIVTPALFERFPTPAHLKAATPEEVEPYIATVGLFRNKAKHLVGLGTQLVDKHKGKVPKSREALQALPGVGRKTANVVLSCAFGIPAIAVDTHVFRVSQRIGLAQGDNVDVVERCLMKSIPKRMWNDAHHWLILHGRRVCKARKPSCDECPLWDLCLYRQLELGANRRPWKGKTEWEE